MPLGKGIIIYNIIIIIINPLAVHVSNHFTKSPRPQILTLWSLKLCLQANRKDTDLFQQHQMHKLSLHCWEGGGKKNHCSCFGVFDISCVPQRAAVFSQHKQPALRLLCPIYLQLLTNPKRQVISSLQRTVSSSGSGRRGEEEGWGGSYQQLQQQFHSAPAACRSQRCPSQCMWDDVVVVWTWISWTQWVWARTKWRYRCERAWMTFRRGNTSKRLVCHDAKHLSSCRPLWFRCCHVAPFSCQSWAHSSINTPPPVRWCHRLHGDGAATKHHKLAFAQTNTYIQTRQAKSNPISYPPPTPTCCSVYEN